MSLQTWTETLITAQGDGTALASSTAATSILPPAARYTLPANFFSVIGKTIRIRAAGRVSGIVTTPGTLTMDIRLGTVATPIVVFNGGAMVLNTTAETNASWTFDAELTCRAIGASTSANLMGTALMVSRILATASAVGAAGGDGALVLPDTAPAVGTGFDSTITNVVDLFATWSISNSGNSIQLHQYALTAMN